MYLKYISLAMMWWTVWGITDTEPLLDMDPPYCTVRYRRLCQGKGRHVACQFPAPGPGESCLNYTQIKFTKELRHFVTHYINRRRQRLAAGNERVRGGVHLPRPEVMMQVEWDRELALLAQRLADQCNFVHDDCRATVRYPYAGQTVGEVKWRRSSGETEGQNTARAIRRVLDAWWGERRRVTVKQLTQPFRLIKGTVWGHFSQLAVWTLRAVGCGAVRHGIRYPRILLVCDFSHTNMLGQRTLSPGLLAPCPIHTARRPRSSYPLLCASVKGNGRNLHEKNPRKKLGIDETGYDAYEPEYEDNDDLYDDEDEEEGISINASTPKILATPARTNKKTKGTPEYAEEHPDPKDIENVNVDVAEVAKENLEIDDDRDRTTRPHAKLFKQNNELNMRHMIDSDRKLPKGFISRDDDIDKYNNLRDIESRNVYNPVREKQIGYKKSYTSLNDDIYKFNNLRTRPWVQNKGDTQLVRGPQHAEKELIKSKSKEKMDDLTLRRQLDYNAQLFRDPTTSRPRLVQRLENVLEGDEGPSFSPTGFDNSRWTLTELYYQYRTKDWTLLSPGTVPPNKLLEFRSRASTPGTTLYYDTVRQRWRPTRDRPDRPGAKALVDNTVLPSTTRARAAKKASSMAMKMDKEDVEQLFRDTGFKPKEKKVFHAE